MLSKLKKDKYQLLGFILIALAVLLVYSPSLMHVPRGDQIMYLAEVGHKQSLWDLTIGSIDLNRHRLFNPGDEILFRPVDYIFLGLQKYFFGHQFIFWQAMGILLHLIVIWQLLSLFLLIYPGLMSVVMAASFALMFVNIEMVIWHHITSYMIFIACSLLAIKHFYLICLKEGEERTHQYWMLGALIIASFTHEMGNVLAVILAVFAYASLKDRPLGRKLLWVPLIYLATSFLNIVVHQFNVFSGHHPQAFSQIIKDIILVLTAWVYAGIFPFELQWLMTSRNIISPEENPIVKWIHLNNSPSLLALIVCLLGAFCALRYRPIIRENRIIAVLAIGMMLVFAVIIVLGRGTQWLIWETVRVNTYYMYIFWVFFSLLAMASINWKDVTDTLKRTLTVLLMMLMFFNAQKLYEFNEREAHANNDINVLVNTLNLMVKEHGHEKDFSFYVAPKYPGNYVYEILKRVDDPENREYSFAEVLYPQYFTTQNPKYKLLTR